MLLQNLVQHPQTSEKANKGQSQALLKTPNLSLILHCVHIQKSVWENTNILRDTAETCPKTVNPSQADYSLHQNPRYVAINKINVNTPKRKPLF